MTNEIVIFADGAARRNPGPGGWGTIVVRPGGEVRELGGVAAPTTNNKMELTAVIEGLRTVASVEGPVRVFSDSTYVIQGITRWIHGWRQRNWRTAENMPVLNRDLWEKLSALVESHPGRVSWQHVRGHAGIVGNERADEIACDLADGKHVSLYRGPLERYPVPILPLPRVGDVPPRRNKSRGSRDKSKATYSYLSAVGGTVVRHRTWSECEKRVRGVSGARFKKATSAEHEREILRDWGFDPDRVRL